jgi:hypothetical protein
MRDRLGTYRVAVLVPTLALTVDSAKTIALVVLLALLLIAALVAKITASITKKIVVIVICVGLGAVVWSQRQALQSCADRVRESTDRSQLSCSFFGKDIRVQRS